MMVMIGRSSTLFFSWKNRIRFLVLLLPITLRSWCLLLLKGTGCALRVIDIMQDFRKDLNKSNSMCLIKAFHCE